MTPIPDATLLAYLDDALGETESAFVERELRANDSLRGRLRELLAATDHGEHSVGAIWRRHHLSCPTREQIGSYLLDVLSDEHRAYITFHLDVIGCPFCQANLADLKNKDRDALPAQQFRQRVYNSSVDTLRK